MNRETIKRLNGDAARLLLVLLTCDGTVPCVRTRRDVVIGEKA